MGYHVCQRGSVRDTDGCGALAARLEILIEGECDVLASLSDLVSSHTEGFFRSWMSKGQMNVDKSWLPLTVVPLFIDVFVDRV